MSLKNGVFICVYLLLSFQLLALSFCGHCMADVPALESKPSTMVVTCATGELGTAIAKVLGRDYNLILTGRDSLKLQALQKQLQVEYPWQYEVCQLDYVNQASIVDFKNKISNFEQSVAGLVLITPRPNFAKNLLQEEAEWLQLFQTIFTGPLEALKATLPKLSKGSKIVVIAGNTSVQYMPEYGPACILRRMWTTYSKALAYELGPKEIYVNVLSPGVILTNFHEERIANKAVANDCSYEAQMSHDVAKIPLGRHAKPSEIAHSVKFLLSEDSNFITGVNLVIDGGLTTSY